MTPQPGETERPDREAPDDPVATGLAAVQEELASQPSRRETVDSAGATQPVARGDVRLVEPLPWMEGRRRLAVVRRVDAQRDAAEMMLAHPWPELATDTDAVIASDDSGLPHPLVVECYVRGPVWLLQLRERIGVLTGSLLEAIGDVVVDRDQTVEGVYAGSALAGPTDPRWQFKEDEVREWGTLTDDCAAAQLEDDDPWLLEPERLHPQTYRETSEPAAPPRGHLRLAETVHLLATRPVTTESQELAPETIDPGRWIECLGRDIGIAAFTALQPIRDQTLSTLSAPMLMKVA